MPIQLGLKTSDVVKAYKRNKGNASATAKEFGCSPAAVKHHVRKNEAKKAK